MVRDNEIKATVSPFAIRPGEIKVFDGKDGYVSMNQIIHKINLGHINDLHFKILELVNEFEFITSRQIYQMLERKGIEPGSQDKLNNKLEQLVKSKILTRYYFDSKDGKGIYRVYCLEKMGKYLLDSRGIECKWQPTDNTKPVAMIKKRLAGNQVIIAYLNNGLHWFLYLVCPFIFIIWLYIILCIFIFSKKRFNFLRRFSLAFASISVVLLVIEGCIDLFKDEKIIFNWSIYAVLPIAIVSILIFIFSYNKKLIDEIKQRIFI